MYHVKSQLGREEAVQLAEKSRRMMSWFDKARRLHGGDPGAGAGFAALHLMFFPITYPSYVLFNRPDTLRWVHMFFWPFYEMTVATSIRRGIKNIIWVEGTNEGLLLARNRWGKGIWTPWNIAVSIEPMDHPLVVNSKDVMGVKEVSKEPPDVKDAILLPYTLDEKDAAEYLEIGAEEAIKGNEEALAAIQFSMAFKLYGQAIKGMDSFRIEIEDVKKVLYPFWIAKYEKKKELRITAFAGTRKSRFDKLEIGNAILQNRAFRNKFPADDDLWAQSLKKRTASISEPEDKEKWNRMRRLVPLPQKNLFVIGGVLVGVIIIIVLLLIMLPGQATRKSAHKPTNRGAELTPGQPIKGTKEIAPNAVYGQVLSLQRGTITIQSLDTGRVYTVYVGRRTYYYPRRYPSVGNMVKVLYIDDRGYMEATQVQTMSRLPEERIRWVMGHYESSIDTYCGWSSDIRRYNRNGQEPIGRGRGGYYWKTGPYSEIGWCCVDLCNDINRKGLEIFNFPIEVDLNTVHSATLRIHTYTPTIAGWYSQVGFDVFINDSKVGSSISAARGMENVSEIVINNPSILERGRNNIFIVYNEEKTGYGLLTRLDWIEILLKK